jgi:hypothetical protein
MNIVIVLIAKGLDAGKDDGNGGEQAMSQGETKRGHIGSVVRFGERRWC